MTSFSSSFDLNRVNEPRKATPTHHSVLRDPTLDNQHVPVWVKKAVIIARALISYRCSSASHMIHPLIVFLRICLALTIALAIFKAPHATINVSAWGRTKIRSIDRSSTTAYDGLRKGDCFEPPMKSRFERIIGWISDNHNLESTTFNRCDIIRHCNPHQRFTTKESMMFDGSNRRRTSSYRDQNKCGSRCEVRDFLWKHVRASLPNLQLYQYS